MTGSEPRIAPLPADDWDDEVFDALRLGRDCLLNDRLRKALEAEDALLLAELLPSVVSTILQHPRLAGRFLAWNGTLLSDPCLPERLRELLILRILWRTRAHNEWISHGRIAARCGISTDEVEAVKRGSEDGAWTPVERALMSAADQLIDGYSIEEATWKELAQNLEVPQLIEVPFVVGTYTCLTMAINSFGIGTSTKRED